MDRIKENDRLKTEANKNGKRISTKRSPKLPEKAKNVAFTVEDIRITNKLPYMELHWFNFNIFILIIMDGLEDWKLKKFFKSKIKDF